MTEKQLVQVIKDSHLIEPKDRLIVGVSGGADSVCLFRGLLALSKQIPFWWGVCHVNHGIRGTEAKADCEFVKELCLRNFVPFFSFYGDVPKMARDQKISQEEAGREFRYKCFMRLVSTHGANKIVTAHHGDDQAETVLYRLLRGTGIDGMAGIAPSLRLLEEEMAGRNIDLVRPLLSLSRKEIEETLLTIQQDYRVDATNQENDYTRNYLRNVILPALNQKVNGKASKHLMEFARQAAEISDYLGRECQKAYEKYVSLQEGQVLLTNEIEKLPEALKKPLCFLAIESLTASKKDFTADHVKNICKLFESQPSSSLNLPMGLSAHRVYEGVRIVRKENKAPLYGIIRWELLEGEEALEKGKKSIDFNEKSYTKWMDYDKIEGNLAVRTRRPGDEIMVFADGRRRKLKNFLVDQKVPRENRDFLPLLVDDQDVLWIPGIRMSEKVKITKESKHLLRVSYEEPKES